MATETETLKIIIALKDSASRGIKRLASGLGNVRDKARGAMGSLGGLRGIIATVGAGLLARSFLKAATAAESYRVRLNVLLGSQSEGNRLFKEMAGFASTVSFQYEEIMGSATNLAGVMRGGTDEIKQWMPLIADLAAATGMTVQDTTGQIIRMYSAGAASADMFRERGVLAMLGFQAKVSYSAEETRAQLMKVFEDPRSQFKGAATELASTWDGMLSMMSDRWFQFRNMVMDAGVFDFIKAGLNLWLKTLEDLKKEGDLDKWAMDMSEVVMKAMSNIAISVGWVMDAFRGLKMMIDGLKLLFALMGKVAADESKDMAENQNKFLDIAKGYNEAQEDIGNKAVEIGKKIEAAYGPDSGVDQWVGWWAGAFAKVGEAIAKDGAGGARMMEGLKDKTADVNKEADELDGWLDGILESTLLSLQATADQVPWNERVKKQLQEIYDLIEKQRAARAAANAEEKAAPDVALTTAVPRGGPEAGGGLTLTARLRKELAQYRETTKTQLAFIDAAWERHALNVEGYFATRVALAEAAFQHDLTRLQQLADAEKEPKKREKLLLDIFKLQEAHKRNLLAIDLERNKALDDRVTGERESAQMVADAEGRAATTGGAGLAVQFAEQLREMEDLQRTESEKMQDLRDAGHATEQQAQDLHNAQMLEKEKLLDNQRRQIIDGYVTNVTNVLSDLGGAFLEYYKATGSKNKEFFEIYKHAAVAETIVSTIKSAQKAYEAEMDIKGPGATIRAVIAASAATVAGMARVAAIRAQSMAEGGRVRDYTAGGRIAGSSPHDKADNVPVNATAGEYMHPVRTVRHYGLAAMDAIRRRLVPRDMLNAFANPTANMPVGDTLATGGLVASTAPASTGDSYSVSVPISTIDTMDGLVDRLQAAAEGAVRNVLREELG